MRWRTPRRVAERQRANAELCGMALTDWMALPRAERRDPRRKATKGARRG